MLYWVILDSGRELQFVSIWRNHFNDFIGPESAVVQLVAWLLRGDILGVEPDLIAYFEGRRRPSLAVSILLLAVLCMEHLCL